MREVMQLEWELKVQDFTHGFMATLILKPKIFKPKNSTFVTGKKLDS